MFHMVIKKSRVKALLFSYSSGDIFACGKCDGVVLEERFAFTIPPSRLRVPPSRRGGNSLGQSPTRPSREPPLHKGAFFGYAAFLITEESLFTQRGLFGLCDVSNNKEITIFTKGPFVRSDSF